MQAYERLEKRWAEFNEVDPAGMVACSSGTAALHLAMEVLPSSPFADVWMPDFTMVACARAARLAQRIPHFLDCGNNLLVDPIVIADSKTDREIYDVTLLVHVYGRTVPTNISTAFDIEDLAEAHGVRPAPSTDAACWSFYKNKIVCGEEGGAVWFNNPERAKVARELRSLGFGPNQDYRHRPRGHNYRLANLLAEPILESIERYKDNVEMRWTRFENYRRQKWSDRIRHRPSPVAPWVFDLWIPGMNYQQQDELVKALRDAGVSARHAFKPMSSQEEFKRCRVYGNAHAVRMSMETIIFHLHTADAPWQAREITNRVVDSWKMPYQSLSTTT